MACIDCGKKHVTGRCQWCRRDRRQKTYKHDLEEDDRDD